MYLLCCFTNGFGVCRCVHLLMICRRSLSKLIDTKTRALAYADSVRECDQLPLSRRQRELCKSSRAGEGAALVTVAARASLAATRECQRHFAEDRWQCQHFSTGPLFGRSIKHRGTFNVLSWSCDEVFASYLWNVRGVVWGDLASYNQPHSITPVYAILVLDQNHRKLSIHMALIPETLPHNRVLTITCLEYSNKNQHQQRDHSPSMNVVRTRKSNRMGSPKAEVTADTSGTLLKYHTMHHHAKETTWSCIEVALNDVQHWCRFTDFSHAPSYQSIELIRLNGLASWRWLASREMLTAQGAIHLPSGHVN